MDTALALPAVLAVQEAMASGYEGPQAVHMCMTASRNPGVPVAFGHVDGGCGQVVFTGTWEVSRS